MEVCPGNPEPRDHDPEADEARINLPSASVGHHKGGQGQFCTYQCIITATGLRNLRSDQTQVRKQIR